MTEAVDELFWDVAEPFLVGGAERSTMMGFPCLRIKGAFFATFDHRTGDLIVKLPAPRVDELIDSGVGAPFAPNGRPFKEWAAIGARDETLWATLTEEASQFAVAKAS